jgi:putative surface cell wall-binding protein
MIAMNWKYRLLAIAGVSALGIGLLGVTSNAALATDAQVTVTTSDGQLTATATDINLGSYQFSVADQMTTPNSNLVIAVTDARGTGDGWHLTVSSTDFFSNGSGQDIPVSGFKYAGAGSVALNSGQAIDGTSGPLVAPALSGTTVGTSISVGSAQSLFGSGSYTYTLPVALLIPGGSLIDVYNATLSITAVTGP